MIFIHQTYTKLTGIEKKVFRQAIHFCHSYCVQTKAKIMYKYKMFNIHLTT